MTTRASLTGRSATNPNRGPIMKKSLSLALIAAAMMTQVAAQAGDLTLYEHSEFRGRAVQVHDHTRDLTRVGFNDTTSSLVVRSGRWEICMDADFRGYCQVYSPGQYARLDPRFNDRISSARDLDDRRDDRHDGWRSEDRRDDRGPGPGPGGWHDGAPPNETKVILYTEDDLHGRSVEIRGEAPDFVRFGFNDRVESMSIRGMPWEFCRDSKFRGSCTVMQPGDYLHLNRGMDRSISSARPVGR